MGSTPSAGTNLSGCLSAKVPWCQGAWCLGASRLVFTIAELPDLIHNEGMARVTVAAEERPALESLADETRRLFFRLRAASAQAHGNNDVTAGLRGVMHAVADGGAQTVPQMARARLVSRQHIQVLVDELAQRRLVELVSNPAHKRSKLVRLTSHGRTVFDRVRRRERRVFERLDLTVGERDLRKATRVLRAISETLDKAIQT